MFLQEYRRENYRGVTEALGRTREKRWRRKRPSNGRLDDSKSGVRLRVGKSHVGTGDVKSSKTEKVRLRREWGRELQKKREAADKRSRETQV